MQIFENVDLSEHTSYKIGGKARKLYIIESVSDIDEIEQPVLEQAYILGAGTNILIDDKGIDAPVIKVDITEYSIDEEKVLTVGAGYLLKEIGKLTAEMGLNGLVSVSGIPGSIGGAIVMNAGASYGKITDFLIKVRAVNRETREKKDFWKSECGFGHRKSVFQNGSWLVYAAKFQLHPADKKELLSVYKKIEEHRKKNYPSIFPSAGCWFRGSWGKKDVVKKVGMAGKWSGKAVVSPMFPAFILNTGGASFKDVYSLVKAIQSKAKKVGEKMPLEIDVWRNQK